MNAPAEYQSLAALVDRAADDDGVLLTRASTIKVEPIAWLWPDWLARGKLHMLAGAPGQGKTTLALAMAATVSSGGRWPDGKRCAPADALIWSGEDDAADTLVPRLMAMGADLNRVHLVQGARVNGTLQPFDPARDMAALEPAALSLDAGLIVLDPIVSAITGDSHKNTEVRRGMQPLVDLASKLRAAVVGISHLSKGTAGRDPTERVTGSIAFTAVVRVVMLAARTKDDEGRDRRVLVRSKSNIGPDSGGFEYHVEQMEAQPGLPASVVTWGAPVEGTARELLAEPEPEDRADADEPTHDVDEFLRDLLQDGLPAPSKDIKAAARECGYAWRTVHRAAKRIGVKITKGGMAGGWYWTLPKMPNRPEGAEGATVFETASSASSASSTPSVASSAAVAPSMAEARALVHVEAVRRGWSDDERDAWLADAAENPAAVVDVLGAGRLQ